MLRLAVMRWADAVLFYTDEEVTYYKNIVAPSTKLFATNNTIDEQPIGEAVAYWDEERLASFQRENGLEREPTLLYCGRLKPASRLDIALQAIQKLSQNGVGATLAIVGDGPIRSRLESMARELGVAGKVRWLGAIYDERVLAPWFLSASALIHPGPIGLSLLHALNYGLPVTTHGNKASHGPEIAALEDGINGLLFREADAEDLASKIALILSDRYLRDRLSHAALDTVHRRYSMGHMVEGFMGAVGYASAQALRRR